MRENTDLYLVNTPITDPRTRDFNYCHHPPIGISYIAAYCRNKNINVKVLDAAAINLKMDIEETRSTIEEANPAVVGLYINTYCAKDAYTLAQLLRKKGRLIIGGGPHANVEPYECLRSGFDYVVKGEGEEVTAQITERWLNGREVCDLPNLYCLDEQQNLISPAALRYVENLDLLPFPALDLFPVECYSQQKDDFSPYSFFITSRGCPKRCIFCVSSKAIYGKTYRSRTPENVCREIIERVERYNLTKFQIWDDCFTLEKERAKEICTILKKSGIPEKAVWHASTNIDFVDEELLFNLKEAGCEALHFGIEGGDNETLRLIKKNITTDQVINTFKKCMEAGILPIGNFIFGFPEIGIGGQKSIYNLASDLHKLTGDFRRGKTFSFSYTYIKPALLVPFPGSEIYEKYHRQNNFSKWWLRPRPDCKEFLHICHWGDKGYIYSQKFFPYGLKKRLYIKYYTLMILLRNKESPREKYELKRYFLMDAISDILYQISPAIEKVLYGVIKKIKTLLKI